MQKLRLFKRCLEPALVLIKAWVLSLRLIRFEVFLRETGFLLACRLTLECLCTFKEIDPIFDRVLLSRTASA